MSTSSPSITYDNSTDALFRAWASAFDTALLAIGLSAHAQTGDIDFVTVTKPTAGTQSRGTRVYKWNDGATEIYMRVGYGSSPAGTLSPGVHISFGRSLDGSGNWTGTDSTGTWQPPFTSANGASGIAITTNFCKSGAAVSIAHNEAGAGTSPFTWAMVIDRTRDAGTGTVNNTGVTVSSLGTNGTFQYNAGGATRTMAFVPVGSAPAVSVNIPRLTSFHPPFATSWSNGTDVGVGPVASWWGRPWQSLAGCVVSGTDFASGATFAVSYYGTSHTFRQVGLASDADGYGRLAYIWE